MLPRINRITTDLGDFLLFASRDVVSQSLYLSGAWEPWNIQISLTLLDGLEMPTVVDIGANVGAYAIPVARALASRQGRVHAFEAQRIVFYQLCGNIVLNRLEYCHAYHLAIGEREDMIELPIPDYSSEFNIGALSLDPAIRTRSSMSSLSDSSAVERMRLTTLDTLTLPALSLLKIDVEGMEREVILGAHATLAAFAYPPILFECWSEKEAPWFKTKREATLVDLQELGYRIALTGNVGIALHPKHPRQFEITSQASGEMRINRKQ